MEQANTTNPQPVVIVSEDHTLKPNCRYSNYTEALEFINTINNDVALALVNPKNIHVRPYPVSNFVIFMVKAAFMTGQEMVDKLTLNCGHLYNTNDTHIEFYNNFIKVSNESNITFNTFSSFVAVEGKFFSDPERFYDNHITGFIRP
jgi:hypothetical protein